MWNPVEASVFEDFEREDVFADVYRSVKPQNSNKKQKPVESLSEDEDGFQVQDSDEELILSSSDSPDQVENADTDRCSSDKRRHLHQSRWLCIGQRVGQN